MNTTGSDLTESDWPLLLNVSQLQARLAAKELLLVDLSKREDYLDSHIPGAVHLEFTDIVAERPPIGGLLPDASRLSEVLSRIGLSAARSVVAYDNENGGKACRLLWTLDVLGHAGSSFLDGGMKAWLGAGNALQTGVHDAVQSSFTANIAAPHQADKDYVLAHLGDSDTVFLDTRTAAEFDGTNLRAARGGHIPGAVNFDWVNAMDPDRGMCLRSADELRRALGALGVTPDQEVVTYCQTHHRSSHTYVVLKSLGFTRIRGYAGAWSEWGNDPHTPVEC